MRLSQKKLSPAALKVIGQITVVGDLAKLPDTQLERSLYVEVDGALRAAGGKWNRGKKAHVFDSNPEGPLSDLLTLGGYTDVRQDYGFFPTPKALAQKVVDLARIEPGMTVLEPSAGRGALVLPALKAGGVLTMVEPLAENRDALLSAMPDDANATLTSASDFLTWRGGIFDRVVMNPPFRGQADIDHVTRAFAMLAEGGVLVAIMSAGVKFRTNRKAVDFRALVTSHGGSIGGNPPESFRESGTDVQTVTVVIENN